MKCINRCLKIGALSISLFIYPLSSVALPDQHPLMASHLPKTFSNQLPNLDLLSYGAGHAFYDTSVTLKDEKGNEVKYREQFNKDKKYKVTHSGQTQLVTTNAWFFSPSGVAVSEKDGSWQCTAERPCKEVTQNIIDAISENLQINDQRGSIWMASGIYDLPSNLEQNSSAMLKLNGHLSLIGAGSDFKHVPYDDERPLLKGTLFWNNDSANGNTFAEVQNIRMYTHDNNVSIENSVVNANIHTTGDLSVINADLEKTNTAIGGNIIANKVVLTSSKLNSMGGNGINVKSASVDLNNSELHVQGYAPNNVTFSGEHVSIRNSKLNLHVDSCVDGQPSVRAITDGGGWDFPAMNISLHSSQIIMESRVACSFRRTVTAIHMGGLSSNKAILQDSEIRLEGINDDSFFGIFAMGTIALDNIKINIESGGSIEIFQGAIPYIEFKNKQSHIHLSAPTIFSTGSVIKNNSKPKSLCSENNGSPKVC